MKKNKIIAVILLLPLVVLTILRTLYDTTTLFGNIVRILWLCYDSFGLVFFGVVSIKRSKERKTERTSKNKKNE